MASADTYQILLGDGMARDAQADIRRQAYSTRYARTRINGALRVLASIAAYVSGCHPIMYISTSTTQPLSDHHAVTLSYYYEHTDSPEPVQNVGSQS